MLIFSKTLEEHIEPLKIALDLLKENSLSVKQRKHEFVVQKVWYLGHIISHEGVATDPRKVQAILQWPSPDNITKLRSFLGLTGYYRRFVQNYGTICRPLYDALKKRSVPMGSRIRASIFSIKNHHDHMSCLSSTKLSKPLHYRGRCMWELVLVMY